MIERLKLTHVALRFQDKIYSLPAPNRHHHIFGMIAQETGLSHIDVTQDDQGFLDEGGRFLNRKKALVNALIHIQIKNGKLIGSILTSEDLW